MAPCCISMGSILIITPPKSSSTMVEMMTVLRSFEANHNALMTQDQTLAQLVRWAST